jgi:hypothetical protein
VEEQHLSGVLGHFEESYRHSSNPLNIKYALSLMNEVQCLYVATLLFKKVIKTVKERGFLTLEEKTQIFKTIRVLTCMILDQFGQVGKLLGQLEVPRIQDGHLKEKCAYAYDE